MRRRQFLVFFGSAVTFSWAARAQPTGRLRRIGVLFSGFRENDPEPLARVATLRQELTNLGWKDGDNIRIELRIAGGDSNRVSAYAAELIGLKPDVIIANSAPALTAVVRTTNEIPIVFINVADPIAGGFVTSLAHPAGNITGFTSFEVPMVGKWFGLLKEIAPALTHTLVLRNPHEPAHPGFMRAVDEVAAALHIKVSSAAVHDVGEIRQALGSSAIEPNSGIVVLPSNIISANRDELIQLAAQYRMPAIYPFRYLATGGGLISYGIDGIDLWRRSAPYVDRILRGARPSELPIQQPLKFELAINLKTAKALGLDVPAQLLGQADEVIE